MSRRRPGGFSMLEALGAIIITGAMAVMFASGFAATRSSLETSRAVEWARRLAMIQVGIFEKHATSQEDSQGYPKPRTAWLTPQFPLPPIAAQCAPAPFPDLSAGPVWSMSATVGNPLPTLVPYTTAGTDLVALGAVQVGTGSAWHVLNQCNGVSRWLGSDLATVRGLGITVDVRLANLATQYTRSSDVPPPSMAGWYVLQIVVNQEEIPGDASTSILVHTVMLIMG